MGTGLAIMVAIWARLDSQPRSIQFVLALVAFVAFLFLCALLLYLIRRARPKTDTEAINSKANKVATNEPQQRFPTWSILSAVVLSTMIIVGVFAPPNAPVKEQSESPKNISRPALVAPEQPKSQSKPLGFTPSSHTRIVKKKELSPNEPATSEAGVKGDKAAVGTITAQPGSVVSVNQSGGQTAQIIVNESPKPRIEWTQELRKKDGSDTTLSTLIRLSVDHSVELPAFVAKCDRPCESVQALVIGPSSADHIKWPNDPTMAGFVFLSPRPLGVGTVDWWIVSKDENPVRIITVNTLSPNSLPENDR